MKYILDEPSLIISFIEFPERVRQNFGHLGFQVESIEELNKRLEKAQKAGLVTRQEIGTNCCFAKQDKFWVSDYDNVQWEVYYFHEDAEFNDPHYERETATERFATLADEKPAVGFKNLVLNTEVPANKNCC